MAGLKKGKKDGSGSSMVLIIFLIFFVLTSIGLGVFAYYGYEGQEELRQKARTAEAKEKAIREGRDQDALTSYMGRLALGFELTPDDKTQFNVLWNNFIASPDKFPEMKPVIDAMHAQSTADLKSWNANEVKYETSYRVEIAKAIEDTKKSKAMLDATQKEFNDFKGNYDQLLAKYEKDVQDMLDRIAKGNQDALAAALKTNTKFPEIQKALMDRETDIKTKDEEHIKELEDRDGRIARLNQQIADLEKKLNDRSLGAVAAQPGSGATDLHALMLDISRGIPLWDRPLGKIQRVDPTNLQVYIDIGKKAGVRPDITFNVFTAGPGGKADRQLKGTIEVTRVLNDTTSVARITSLYTPEGESIPLTTQGARSRAIREADNLLREGDLLFNMFFDMHVFVAGNVNFTGYNSDSPAGQALQLQEFLNQLRKQNVVVDGYINLLNGQVEGTITPKTRVLIRGEISQINRTEEETNRYKILVETYQILKRQAVDQGMFIISAENFAAVTGYRPAAMQTSGDNSAFRASLPWVGNSTIQRFDRVVEGQLGAGALAPMPNGNEEMKKE